MKKKISVVTTIHTEYDARIYERTIIPLSRYFQVEVISPWHAHPISNFSILWNTRRGFKTRFDRIKVGFDIFISAFKSDSQSIHFHDLDFIIWASLLKIFTKKKIIYDCHENYSEEILYGKPWIPDKMRFFLSRVVYYLENLCCILFDAIIVVVPHQQNRFEKKFREKVFLIRNLSIYLAKRDILHDKNVLYTGSISKNYGGEIILNLARLMRDRKSLFKIIMFEKFDSDYQNYFLNAIRQDDLPIQILPKFSRGDISKIMKMGAVGLSIFEDSFNKQVAYPAKIFEYMSFGIPVVASDSMSHRLILNQARSGILVQNNPEKILIAIESILSDESKRNKLIENGFRAIEEEFSWSNEEKKLLDLYRSLLL